MIRSKKILCGCLATGIILLCAGCGKCEHQYLKEVIKEPTCTETGIVQFKCSNCNDSYEETIASLGHNYQEISNTANCKSGGKAVYKCSLCGDSYEESIGQTGHIYNSDDGNICKSCGLKFMNIPKLPFKIKNIGGSMELLRLTGTIESVKVIRNGKGISLEVQGKKDYDVEDSEYNINMRDLLFGYEIYSPNGECIQAERIETGAFETGETFDLLIPITFDYKEEETYSVKFFGIFDIYGDKDFLY